MSAADAPARSFTCLVNPHAGGGAGLGRVVEVARALREAGARVKVVYSPGIEETPALARAAVEAGDVVLAVGGDGMVASVVGELADLAECGGVLGLVPAGRGNDFARMLGVPGDTAGLARRLLEGDPRPVDVLDVRGPQVERSVAGSVYAGVDAEAAAMVARMRRVPKPVQYPYAGLRAISRYVPHRYTLVLDGVEHSFDAATVVLANSAYYGSGMRIAPDAVVDDGLLDVVVVGAGSRLALARAFPQLYDGRHVHHPEVTLLRGRRAELSAMSARAVPVGGDGEDLGMLPGPDDPLVVSVRHRALMVL